MNITVRFISLILITSLSIFACSSQPTSPYKNSAEAQKANAEKAQRELSRETSRY